MGILLLKFWVGGQGSKDVLYVSVNFRLVLSGLRQTNSIQARARCIELSGNNKWLKKAEEFLTLFQKKKVYKLPIGNTFIVEGVQQKGSLAQNLAISKKSAIFLLSL